VDAAGQENLAARLEMFLLGAAEAEARGDLAEAERAFRRALFCEAKLRPDVTDVLAYVRSAGPLYPAGVLPASGGSDAAVLA
jgi:hypothetical protein